MADAVAHYQEVEGAVNVNTNVYQGGRCVGVTHVAGNAQGEGGTDEVGCENESEIPPMITTAWRVMVEGANSHCNSQKS